MNHELLVNIEHYATLIIALGGALTTCFYIIRKFYQIFKKFSEHLQAIDNAMPTLLKIAEEFKPNHGSSLRDSIDRIEEEMLRTQIKVHALLSTTHVAYLVIDGKNECSWANCKYLEIMETTVEQVLHRGWISHIHPEDRGTIIEEWTRAIADKRDFRYIYRLLKISGEEIKVLVTANMTYRPITHEFAGALFAIIPYDERDRTNLVCPYDYPCVDKPTEIPPGTERD